MRYWRVLSALLSIAACAAGQTTAPSRPKMLRLPAGADRVVIPLETAGALLIAKVSVNGKEPGRFIVDTGAPTAVDWDFAKRVKMQDIAPGQPNGGVVPVRVFRVERLSCGPAEFAPVLAPGFDLKQFSSLLGFPVAGVLGNDLLGQAPFQIDYHRRTLTMYDPKKFSPPPDAIAVPLLNAEGVPTVEISVEGYRIEAEIDTGDYGISNLCVVPFVDHPNLGNYILDSPWP